MGAHFGPVEQTIFDSDLYNVSYEGCKCCPALKGLGGVRVGRRCVWRRSDLTNGSKTTTLRPTSVALTT